MSRAPLIAGAITSFLVIALAITMSAVIGDYAGSVGGVFYAAVPIVGLIVIRARPRNVVGWCFLASAALLGLERAGETTATEGLRRDWPGAVVHTAAWLQAWSWFPGLFLLITVALLRFPDSRLVAPGWRWVERASYAAMGVWVIGLGVAAAFIPSRQLMSSAQPEPDGVLAGFFLVAESMFFVVFTCALLSLASLVIRYRRGARTEREQIKWVLSAAALAIFLELVLDIGGSVAGPWPDWTQTIGESVSFAMIAVGTGVAITRYKLYEIERIVSRTVAYALVLVILGGLYAGLLLGLAELVPRDLGQVGVAAATLLISVVAVPLTRRARRVVDRRFNRSRFDAERVVTSFAAGLRARPERGDVPGDLLEVLHRTVQPAHAGVWLLERAPAGADQLRPAPSGT